MSFVHITFSQLQDLLRRIEKGDLKEYLKSLKKIDNVPAYYHSLMGSAVLCAEVEKQESDAKHEKGMELTSDHVFRFDFDEICLREKDLRCQVGQIMFHLKRKNLPSKPLFERNANSTVILVDKEFLNLPEITEDEEFELPNVESWEKLDLSKFGEANKRLCDGFFYANERVPHTNIFGSGVFFEHNRILTAAHVLDAIYDSDIRPDKDTLQDLLIIRGFHVVKNKKTIKVHRNQLYVLDQGNELYVPGHVFHGGGRGDVACLQVKRLYPDAGQELVYDGPLCDIGTPDSFDDGNPVYALGHGFGVPMKLSFKGIAGGMSALNSGYFNCDINIIPGASGSPVFDSNTHRLIGIVGGLNGFTTDFDSSQDCVWPIVKMDGEYSGLATPVFPILDFIQNS